MGKADLLARDGTTLYDRPTNPYRSNVALGKQLNIMKTLFESWFIAVGFVIFFPIIVILQRAISGFCCISMRMGIETQPGKSGDVTVVGLYRIEASRFLLM